MKISILNIAMISIIIFCLALLCGCNTYSEAESLLNNEAESTPKKVTWEAYTANPVIKVGQNIKNIIWNDPSVIKEGSKYRMWLSGGTGIGINHVKIYHATSSEGLNWSITPTPILEPGSAGEWDDEKIETPSVIKVGSTYHLYYSGFKTGDDGGRYQIGHATSSDGITWIKDPNNPIIPYSENPSLWGFYHAAEPGAVYNPKNKTIYLYYMTTKLRPGYKGKNPHLNSMHGICLATSQGNDGSKFLHYDSDSDGNRDAVLVQSSNYPPAKNYRGYSTPSALIYSNGLFHLFYDVVVHPKGGHWQQVALAHATSLNGNRFTEVEHDIFTRGLEKWTKTEVRAPTVIQEGGYFKMWYAGHTDWFESSGIGYATDKRK
jgi:predicted GH43/DUF377 family glycosyl hydrolase